VLAGLSYAEPNFLGCGAAPYKSEMQEAALVNFYKNTGGPTKWPESLRKGWDHPNGICAFDNNPKAHGYNPYGTRCMYGGFHPEPPKGDGGVMYLNHGSGMAEGTLPEEFKALWMTIIMQLSHNKLSGTLWDTSKHCFMNFIDLSYNQFSGSLPSNFMASGDLHMSNMVLSHNNFEGSLPESIGNLKNLVALMLSDNKFSGALPDFSHLVELRHLDLQNNQFSGSLGSWFGELKNVAWVELDGNQFSGPLPPLPPQVSRFTANGNKFTGDIPAGWATQGFLRHFECTGCDIKCPTEDFLAHIPYSTHCHKGSRAWPQAI
jgi:hypothetical protein